MLELLKIIICQRKQRLRDTLIKFQYWNSFRFDVIILKLLYSESSKLEYGNILIYLWSQIRILRILKISDHVIGKIKKITSHGYFGFDFIG